VDRELYRRRQRRRALIAWSTLGLLVAVVALVAIFGGRDGGGGSSGVPSAGAAALFSSEMTSRQYEALHQGEEESRVLARLHSVGLGEDQVGGSGLASLFAAPPAASTCSYWTLSDAPGHFVRLCFGDPSGLLLEKSVAAPDAEGAPQTLA
jgi:hypothetical protein